MPDDSEEIPSSRSPLSTGFQLSGQQRVLYQALMHENERLARMYLGALLVIEQTENPENIVQAAHSLRELMEKLPRYRDLPVKQPLRLKEKVINLSQYWPDVTGISNLEGRSSLGGVIDKSLQKFLKEAHGFFEWFEKQYQTKKEQAAILLRGLDPRKLPLPGPIEDLRIMEWYKYDEYLQGLSHHGKTTSLEEFRSWLGAIEKFLLDHLCPRTFEDQKEIKEIIEEGEKNGEAGNSTKSP